MPEATYNFMLLITAIVFAGAHLIETEPTAAKWLQYTTIGISGMAAIAAITLIPHSPDNALSFGAAYAIQI